MTGARPATEPPVVRRPQRPRSLNPTLCVLYSWSSHLNASQCIRLECAVGGRTYREVSPSRLRRAVHRGGHSLLRLLALGVIPCSGRPSPYCAHRGGLGLRSPCGTIHMEARGRTLLLAGLGRICRRRRASHRRNRVCDRLCWANDLCAGCKPRSDAWHLHHGPVGSCARCRGWWHLLANASRTSGGKYARWVGRRLTRACCGPGQKRRGRRVR